MKTSQKVIKYLAIAFAIFLIITIIYAIINGAYAILKHSGLVNNSNQNKVLSDLITISDNTEEISSLRIEIKGSDFKIVKSDKFEVKTNNSDIKYSNQNGNVEIKEDRPDKWYFGSSYDGEVIIYMPEGMNQLDRVDIKVGAGKINMEKLNTKDLYLDLGAGEMIIENLIVSNTTKINGGAGDIKINSGNIANVDIDLGVGQTTIRSDVTGNSKIETGVGALNLYLALREENYSIEAKKGLGQISYNEKGILNDTRIGTGENYIKIEGGVGRINITTNEQ